MNRPFLILLIAKAVSATGSQVTLVALPLTALLVLRATPFQMGLLAGAGPLAGVLLGLFAGVAIDGLDKRRVLLLANGASALVLATVPLGYLAGALTIPLLLAIAFLAAGIANAEGIAVMSLMPLIIPADQLGPANGRLGAATATARVIGPAIAGVLIVLVTAPGAITADALSFTGATFLMLALPQTPRGAPGATAKPAFTAQLRDAKNFVFGDPTVKLFTLIGIGINFFGAGFGAIKPLLIVRQLGVPAHWYGAALAVEGVGAVLGALASARLARRFNVNFLLLTAIGGSVVFDGTICTLHGPPLPAAAIFAFCSGMNGFSFGVLNVAIVTYMQKEIPADMLARVFGALTTFIGFSFPLGALAGGTLGSLIGVRPTLIAETFGYVLIVIVTLTTSRKNLAAPA